MSTKMREKSTQTNEIECLSIIYETLNVDVNIEAQK